MNGHVLAPSALPGRVSEILSPELQLDMADENSPPGLGYETSAPDQVVGLLVTVADRVNTAVLDRFPALRAVGTASAGTDHVDVTALSKREIALAAVPGVLTETTADLAWALILAAARRLGEAERVLRSGRWSGWSPLFLTGQDVYGKTLGIVGLGRIGTAVARRAQGFSMTLLYHSRHAQPAGDALSARRVPLETLLAESDVVILALPGGPETRGLIGRQELARMKDEAVLVNIGRGDALDLSALSEELERGRLAGVGLDVYPEEPLPPSHPILTHERVVALPHIGSATLRTRVGMAEGAARAVKALLLGEDLPDTAVRVL